MTYPSQLLLGYERKRPSIGFQVQTLKARRHFHVKEGHILSVAPTGKGKGRSAIIPTLLSYPGPVLVIDPKGEAAAITARHRKTYGEVVIIDPFRVATPTPDTLNPLDLHTISNDTTVEQALLISDLLQLDHGGSKEPFWNIRGTALLSGVLAYILSAKPEKDRHLGTLKTILAGNDVSYDLAVTLDTQGSVMDPFAYKEIAQVLQLPEITRGGIIATAQQHIYLFDDSNVLNSVSTTSFDLGSFVRGDPITIYLILPPTKLRSHAVLLRLWTATLLYALFERKRLPELPNLFIIDEAAQLGTLNLLRTAMTLMRGYGLRCWTFWQDLSQLKHLYKNDWQTLINNAAVFQAFGLTNHLMAKDIAEVTGELSPKELLGLKASEQVLLEQGGKLTIAQKIDYLSDKRYQGKFDPHPMYQSKDQGRS